MFFFVCFTVPLFGLLQRNILRSRHEVDKVLLKKGLRDVKTRKRAKFLVQRVTDGRSFRWFWAIFDSLEEFSAHWVKQNWSKFEDLVEKAFINIEQDNYFGKKSIIVEGNEESSGLRDSVGVHQLRDRRDSIRRDPSGSSIRDPSGSRDMTDGSSSVPVAVVKLSPEWAEFLLEICLQHENDSVRRFVIEKIIERRFQKFSDNFVFNVLFPRISEHGWYLNNSTKQNEEAVKEYLVEFSPHKIWDAMMRHNVVYFVPLRILLETLDVIVNGGSQAQVSGVSRNAIREYGNDGYARHVMDSASCTSDAATDPLAASDLGVVPACDRTYCDIYDSSERTRGYSAPKSTGDEFHVEPTWDFSPSAHLKQRFSMSHQSNTKNNVADGEEIDPSRRSRRKKFSSWTSLEFQGALRICEQSLRYMPRASRFRIYSVDLLTAVEQNKCLVSCCGWGSCGTNRIA